MHKQASEQCDVPPSSGGLSVGASLFRKLSFRSEELTARIGGQMQQYAQAGVSLVTDVITTASSSSAVDGASARPQRGVSSTRDEPNIVRISVKRVQSNDSDSSLAGEPQAGHNDTDPGRSVSFDLSAERTCEDRTSEQSSSRLQINAAASLARTLSLKRDQIFSTTANATRSLSEGKHRITEEFASKLKKYANMSPTAARTQDREDADETEANAAANDNAAARIKRSFGEKGEGEETNVSKFVCDISQKRHDLTQRVSEKLKSKSPTAKRIAAQVAEGVKAVKREVREIAASVFDDPDGDIDDDENEDPITSANRERAEIVAKYDKGRDSDQQIDAWEDPEFAAFKSDRYGFIHEDAAELEYKDVFEHKALQLELKREQKWAKMHNNWNKYANSAKYRRRVYKGVPEKTRAVIWRSLLDIDGHILTGVYEQLRLRARLLSPDIRQIDLDINRTYRNHVYFWQRYSVKQQSLFHVLAAYSVYNTEIGYCQGMSQIAALLLMYFDAEDAFWALHILMTEDKYDMHGLFIPGFPKLLRLQQHHDKVLKKMLPSLKKHMDKHDIQAALYTTKWFFQCFLDRVPFRLALRLWDIFLLDGERVLTVMAYNIMKMHKKELAKLNFEHTMEYLQRTLEANFGYSDEEVIESLRTCESELMRAKLCYAPPPTLNEKPTQRFGEAVLTRTMRDIVDSVAVPERQRKRSKTTPEPRKSSLVNRPPSASEGRRPQEAAAVNGAPQGAKVYNVNDVVSPPAQQHYAKGEVIQHPISVVTSADRISGGDRRSSGGARGLPRTVLDESGRPFAVVASYNRQPPSPAPRMPSTDGYVRIRTPISSPEGEPLGKDHLPNSFSGSTIRSSQSGASGRLGGSSVTPTTTTASISPEHFAASGSQPASSLSARGIKHTSSFYDNVATTPTPNGNLANENNVNNFSMTEEELEQYSDCKERLDGGKVYTTEYVLTQRNVSSSIQHQRSAASPAKVITGQWSEPVFSSPARRGPSPDAAKITINRTPNNVTLVEIRPDGLPAVETPVRRLDSKQCGVDAFSTADDSMVSRDLGNPTTSICCALPGRPESEPPIDYHVGSGIQNYSAPRPYEPPRTAIAPLPKYYFSENDNPAAIVHSQQQLNNSRQASSQHSPASYVTSSTSTTYSRDEYRDYNRSAASGTLPGQRLVSPTKYTGGMPNIPGQRGRTPTASPARHLSYFSTVSGSTTHESDISSSATCSPGSRATPTRRPARFPLQLDDCDETTTSGGSSASLGPAPIPLRTASAARQMASSQAGYGNPGTATRINAANAFQQNHCNNNGGSLQQGQMSPPSLGGHGSSRQTAV